MTKSIFNKGQCETRLTAIAATAYALIAETFPICAASDEFYFFPQVSHEPRDWFRWDDFSVKTLADRLTRLQSCEIDLAALVSNQSMPDDLQTDLWLLMTTLKTLREQLIDVAPHRNQPTFHLTIIACGLTEAIQSADPEAWAQRAAGLQDFVDRAEACLENVPEIFLVLGQAMLADLRAWLVGLTAVDVEIASVTDAFDRFQDLLNRVSTCRDVLLEEQVLHSVVAEHLGSTMDIDTALSTLNEEHDEMHEQLQQHTSRLTGRRDWREALASVPFCAAPGQDLLALYRPELLKIEEHCRTLGLVPGSLPLTGRLDLQPVPDYLQAIRASDAYAARPGSPPRGGTFYVQQTGHERDGVVGRTLEYRVTAVHETWPGHHLLDMARWASPHVLRRPIEQPLFYEGWACLAEELMMRTGYLGDPWDRFLLVKRRFERAIRGLVDLGLQSGRMTISQAVERLSRAGYPKTLAQQIVPKYLLRPGYQLCYTLGVRQALSLFNDFGSRDPGRFVTTVLTAGEIGFSRLRNIVEVDSF